ncbi:MAG: hypothetical protein ACJ76F_14235 [Bacteroidia bacterium]
MEHHSEHNESPKRVAFGAPIIMGLSFWIITFGFLSMCDGPKECCEGDKECCKEQSECKHEGKEEAKETSEKTMVMDTTNVAKEADTTKSLDDVKVAPVNEETKKEEEKK